MHVVPTMLFNDGNLYLSYEQSCEKRNILGFSSIFTDRRQASLCRYHIATLFCENKAELQKF